MTASAMIHGAGVEHDYDEPGELFVCVLYPEQGIWVPVDSAGGGGQGMVGPTIETADDRWSFGEPLR